MGGEAGDAGGDLAVVEVGGADAQRAHQFVAAGLVVTGVAMHGEHQFDGHALAATVGHEYGTTGEPVAETGAGVEVVVVVVGVVETVVNGVGSTAPLGGIAGAFQTAGQTAGPAAPRDVAHAAAESHGIGGHHAMGLAVVAHYHHVVAAAALVELEGAEIHPGAAAHALVDLEHGLAALVPHRVLGIVNRLGKGLVTHVHGVAARLGDVGLIDYLAQALARRALCHAGSAGAEGVLAIVVVAAVPGKAARGTVAPGVLAVAFGVAQAAVGVVVIHNHLVALPVALAG